MKIDSLTIKTDKPVVIVPDIHADLNLSYSHINYPVYIYDILMSIFEEYSPEDYFYIFLGDIFDNAGTIGPTHYLLLSKFYDMYLNHQLAVVRGNGKHAYNVIRHGKTFEEMVSNDGVMYVHSPSGLYALMGHQKDEGEFYQYLNEVLDYHTHNEPITALLCHQFLDGGFNELVIPTYSELPVPVVAGHNHIVSTGNPNRICLGSLVNTSFGDASDTHYILVDNILVPVDGVIPFIDVPVSEAQKFINSTDMTTCITRLIVPKSQVDLLPTFENTFNTVKLVGTSDDVAKPEIVSQVRESLVQQWEDMAASAGDDVVDCGKHYLKEAMGL